jgi:hypothetical protein
MANEVFDPAYIDWLLNEPQYEGNPSYDEDVLKDQGTWLTQASKGGNLTTDLDYLISSGLLQPGAFEPLSSYKPVEAPGAKRMAQWERGSPYQQYVAEWFKSGRSANELLSDLTRMVAQPSGDPMESNIVRDMPKGQFYDEMTGQYKFTDLPNMASVGEELRSFETDLLGDPSHIIGPDGTPVQVETEESPAMKKWRAAGFVSDPTAGYDPWSFAPEGTREKEQLLPAMAAARQAEVLGRTALMKAANREARSAQPELQRWLDMQRDTESAYRPERGVGSDRPGNPDIPERGGFADDAARFMDSPGEHIGNFLSRLPGRATQLPGAVDRLAENIAGKADRTIGDPLEGRLSGEQALFSLPRSYSDETRNWFMPGTSGNRAAPTGPNRRPLNAGLAGGGAAPGRTLAQMWGAPQDRANVVERGIRRGLERRVGPAAERGRAAQKALDAARERSTIAQYQAMYAARNQAMRQAMADQLMAAGRSPARDEINARNAAAYGLGR